MYRGGLPRQQTYVSQLQKFYRPYSACDLGNCRFKAPYPQVEPRGNRDNYRGVELRLRKRYDYLERSPTDRLGNILRNRVQPSAQQNIIGKYPRYDSLGCLNRRQASRPSFLNDNSQPQRQERRLQRENARPSIRDITNMHVANNRRQQIKRENFYSNKDISRKPALRNFISIQENIENIARRNHSIEHYKLQFDRLGGRPIRSEPNEIQIKKNVRRHHRRDEVTQPLPVDLGVILTESIIQGPNGRVY